MIKQIAKIALILICIVVAAFAKQPLQTSPQTRPEVFAIIDVNVVPMDREGILEHRTIIVRGDRISEIGATESIQVPEGAQRIDGRGKYLMPGLADMHAHIHPAIFTEKDLVLFISNGVTTLRNMWGTPVHLEWRKRINNGELLGPSIYTTGPITDGSLPYWEGSAVVETPEEAEAEVIAQKQAGYDGMKVFTNLKPEVYDALLKAADAHSFPVYGHVPTRLGLEQVLRRGQISFEHMIDFMYALLPDDSPLRADLVETWGDPSKRSLQTLFISPFSQADRDRTSGLAAGAAAAGVWICPTLVVHRKFASDSSEFRALQKQPIMKYVGPVNRSSWDRVESRFTSDHGDPAAMKRGFDTMLSSVKALREAGAKLLVGTDTPNPFVVPGFSLHEELQNFVEAGFTPYEAIRAATRGASEFLDAANEFGTVAVGQRADLLLIDGDPLSDIANTTRIAGVMLRGKWLPKAELSKLLEGVAKSYEEQAAEAAK